MLANGIAKSIKGSCYRLCTRSVGALLKPERGGRVDQIEGIFEVFVELRKQRKTANGCLDVVLIPHKARYVETCDFEFELFCLDAPLKVHLDLPSASIRVGCYSDSRLEASTPEGLRELTFCNTTARCNTWCPEVLQRV